MLKRWTWIVSGVLVVAGLVLLLWPVTALYYIGDHNNPYDVQTIYGTRGDQELSVLTNWDDPNSASATSIRLGCGTAFNAGENEVKHDPDGPAACAIAERPRTIVGWSVAGLGVLGFGAGLALPALRRNKRAEQLG